MGPLHILHYDDLGFTKNCIISEFDFKHILPHKRKPDMLSDNLVFLFIFSTITIVHIFAAF